MTSVFPEQDVLRKNPQPSGKTVTPGRTVKVSDTKLMMPVCPYMKKGELTAFSIMQFSSSKFTPNEQVLVGLSSDGFELWVWNGNGFEPLPAKKICPTALDACEIANAVRDPRAFVINNANRLVLGGWQTICNEETWALIRANVVEELAKDGDLFMGVLSELQMEDDLRDAMRDFFHVQVLKKSTTKATAATTPTAKRKPASAAPKKPAKRKLDIKETDPVQAEAEPGQKTKDHTDSDSECETLQKPAKRPRIRKAPAPAPLPVSAPVVDGAQPRFYVLCVDSSNQSLLTFPVAARPIFKQLYTMTHVDGDTVKGTFPYRTPAAWEHSPILSTSEYEARIALLGAMPAEDIVEISCDGFKPMSGIKARQGADTIAVNSHVYPNVSLDSVVYEPVLTPSPQLIGILEAVAELQPRDY